MGRREGRSRRVHKPDTNHQLVLARGKKDPTLGPAKVDDLGYRSAARDRDRSREFVSYPAFVRMVVRMVLLAELIPLDEVGHRLHAGSPDYERATCYDSQALPCVGESRRHVYLTPVVEATEANRATGLKPDGRSLQSAHI